MPVDVTTASGIVRGTSERGRSVFRGIPFAAVPTRFGAPEPAPAWTGVREATRFGPPPPQSGLLGMDAATDRGDDWLTVNVWTPDVGGRLPVMVWVQGGGYVFGTSGLPEYDGGTLADGVVVVTFNYRVGFEGFGWVEPAPANRGLLDQVAALTWVRDNIAAFGGDPRRVTVFGQSAGGGSVAALMAMPRAAGLFRRAVVQSMPGTFLTPALAADVARACAEELGTGVGELASVDPWLLPEAGDAVLAQILDHAHRWGPAAHAGVPFAPVVDGDVLPTTPWQGLRGDVELLAGHTRDEQRLLSVLSGERGTINEARAHEAAEVFAPDPEAYRSRFPDPEDLYEVVRSDWLFRMPTVQLADAQLAAGGAAHVYELTWPAPGLGGALGACHGLDVPLVFGNLTAGQPAVLIGDPTPAAAEELSRTVRAAWRAFAADGDPGWPSYDTGVVQVLDDPPTIGPYPEQSLRDLWPDHPAVLDLLPDRQR